MSHISSFSSLLSFFTSLFFSNGQHIGREPHPLSHLLTMFSHLGCFPLCSPFFFPPLSSPFCSPVLILFPIRSLLPPPALDIFLVLVSSRCLSSSPYSSSHLSPSYLLSSFILIIFLAFLFISSYFPPFLSFSLLLLFSSTRFLCFVAYFPVTSSLLLLYDLLLLSICSFASLISFNALTSSFYSLFSFILSCCTPLSPLPLQFNFASSLLTGYSISCCRY